MVLPLRVGGGTRIKIYEAMAMGVPVLSTTIGAEGLDVEHDQNILHAETVDQFAEAAIRLLTDAERGDEIARAAREHVASRYSWTRVASIFSEFCREAIRAAAGRVARARP